ncbi:putative Universal stress protein [Streptomyces afghaniensis 772] [Streptomyces afghaniensis]
MVYASLWERYERAVFATGRDRSSRSSMVSSDAAGARTCRKRLPDLKVSTQATRTADAVLVREESVLVLGLQPSR